MTRSATHAAPISEARAESVRALELAFRKLTITLYDTEVPVDRMEAAIGPHLADDVTFKDPWQTGVGKAAYRLGMAGFHSMFRFTFEITQACVTLDHEGSSGRAIVDGVMHLNQIQPVFSYPLRTILTYQFELPNPADPESFLVHAHEEMWSLGDMIEAVPFLGKFYSRFFRPAFAKGFLAASKIASR
jgi:hypothetical protein